MKKKSLSKAKAAAWAALSKVVRYSHAFDGTHVSCVTCGHTRDWKEQQAGHFIPKAQGTAIYFEVDNVHPQCYRCNINLGGNGPEYYRYMLRELGEGGIERLREKQHSIVKFSVFDYENMRAHYDAELERMQAMRADGYQGRIEINAW